MSGIYINGLEMPTDHPLWIVVHSDGTVEANEVSQSRPVGWQTLRNAAVTVPPHGRIIEGNKVLDIVSEWCPDDDGSVGKVGDLREMLDEIEALPTIIPASEEGET